MTDIASWMDGQAARVLDTASACAPLGDASWDALLRELGVSPLSPQERQEHLAAGPKRRGGAAPIEVRLALAAIHDRAHAAWQKMDIDAAERDLSRRLSVFVEDNMGEYMRRVAAPAPTTASIFANARATTPNYGGAVKAGLNQMKCTTCGAPRKIDDPNVGPCVYCGGVLA